MIGVPSLVVIAPHPDDEILGAGGLMAQARAEGKAVGIIVITDGCGSDTTLEPTLLRETRFAETRAALRTMMRYAPPILFLGAMDGKFESSAADVSRTSPLARFMSEFPDAAILVTDPADGHPDHKAAFGLASRLISSGLADTLSVMPISQRIDGPWDGKKFEAVPLAGRQALKREAISKFRSQIGNTTGFSLSSTVIDDFVEVEYFRHAHNPKNGDSVVSPAHFDILFDGSPDPWGYETQPYERDRFHRTIAALDDRHYVRALDLGCANGALTLQLVPHCDAIVALDGSARAVALARNRLRGFASVEVCHAKVPDDLPDGGFDLIMLSDFLYYLGHDGIVELVHQVDARADGNCRIVMANYLGDTECAISGEMAAEIAIAHLPGWLRTDGCRTPRLRLDILERR